MPTIVYFAAYAESYELIQVHNQTPSGFFLSVKIETERKKISFAVKVKSVRSRMIF